MALFEAQTGGAFDRLNWQHSGGFDQMFSKKSNALGFYNMRCFVMFVTAVCVLFLMTDDVIVSTEYYIMQINTAQLGLLSPLLTLITITLPPILFGYFSLSQQISLLSRTPSALQNGPRHTIIMANICAHLTLNRAIFANLQRRPLKRGGLIVIEKTHLRL